MNATHCERLAAAGGYCSLRGPAAQRPARPSQPRWASSPTLPVRSTPAADLLDAVPRHRLSAGVAPGRTSWGCQLERRGPAGCRALAGCRAPSAALTVGRDGTPHAGRAVRHLRRNGQAPLVAHPHALHAAVPACARNAGRGRGAQRAGYTPTEAPFASAGLGWLHHQEPLPAPQANAAAANVRQQPYSASLLRAEPAGRCWRLTLDHLAHAQAEREGGFALGLVKHLAVALQPPHIPHEHLLARLGQLAVGAALRAKPRSAAAT